MNEILDEKDIKIIYQSLKDMKETAIQYQSEIMPVDIDKLNGLLEQTKKDQQTLQGKDVVLILGNKGVGKTTAIHFLAGEKMEFVNQTLKAKQEQQIDTQMQQQLTDLDKGISKFVKINHKNNEVYLLDTPGSKKSDTLENDIATKQSLINSIQRCKSVKPVVIISKNSVGDGLTHVYQLFTSLESIFENFKIVIPYISYLFTQYSDNDYHQLLADFINKLKNLSKQEKSNKVFLSFMKDIINKLSGVDKISSSDEENNDIELQNNAQRLLLNPIQDDHHDVLNYLLQKQIVNPAKIALQIISNESMNSLELQFIRHQKCIIEGISKANYQLVKYKLDQLCLLSHYINIQKFTAMYLKCQTEIVSELQNIGEQYLFQIEQYINNENDNTEHEITATKLLELEQLMQYHVFNKKQSKVCVYQLDKIQQDLYKQLQQEIESDQPFSKKHVLNIMKSIRDSASMLGSNSQIERIYSEACDFVQKAFAKLEQDIATLFKELTTNNTSSIIEKCGNALNKMQIIYQSCKKLINLDYSSYSSSLQIIDDYVTDQLKRLSQDDAKQDTTQILLQFLSVQNILKVLSESKMLQEHVNQKEILKYNNEIQHHLMHFAKQFKKQIQQLLDDTQLGIETINYDNLQDVEIQLNLLQQLVENDDIKFLVDLIVQTSCSIFQKYANTLYTHINNIFNDINGTNIDTQELLSDIDRLYSIDQSFEKISSQYECQSQKLIQQLTQLLKSVNSYQNLEKVVLLTEQYLSDHNLQNIVEETVSVFKEKDLNVIKQINSDIQTESFLRKLKLMVDNLRDLQTHKITLDKNDLERVDEVKKSLIDKIIKQITEYQQILVLLQQESDQIQTKQIVTILKNIGNDLGDELCYQHLREKIKIIVEEWNKVKEMNKNPKNQLIKSQIYQNQDNLKPLDRQIIDRQVNKGTQYQINKNKQNFGDKQKAKNEHIHIQNPEHNNKVNDFNLDCKLKPVQFNFLQGRK
ncbi:helicase_carboxy-terminal domain protein [Hexamita inflata]|uniref:Helicase carboxy-terminal domain protein n=1 Tax=Hexamita inflata TaxID=28002 RepID=A0AA86N901_9EUKA|nr:helicase carboxy-terminal domain protein [Hexamita inflata]